MNLKEAKALVRHKGVYPSAFIMKPVITARVKMDTQFGILTCTGMARWNAKDAGVPGLDWDVGKGIKIAEGRAEKAIAKLLVEAERYGW